MNPTIDDIAPINNGFNVELTIGNRYPMNKMKSSPIMAIGNTSKKDTKET